MVHNLNGLSEIYEDHTQGGAGRKRMLCTHPPAYA